MNISLVSTRDPKGKSVSYADVLLSGLAPDNGLYTPQTLPTVDTVKLKTMQKMSYIELFVAIKSLLIGDSISLDDQEKLAGAAFTQEKFPNVVDGNFMPVVEIEPGFYMQNLSLGPTAAFKDAALQPLGQDMNYVLNAQDKTLRLLGATSGDTGSAAEAAIKGLDRLKLFMLSPLEGMSDFQRAQMGILSGGNIYNLSVRGRFDDCQDMVKALNSDPEFADLGAVNSINWGRISSQVPYYFSGYFQVVGENIGNPVDFVVPTGNFGNILAAYFAKQMGLPIRKLIVATNENDVINRLIQTGVYTVKKAQVTSSPSMDISKASNYERLVYYLLGNDPVATANYMKKFETDGSVDFKDFGLSANALKENGFASGTSTHTDRIAMIRWAHETADLIIDPHTADAFKVAQQHREDGVPILSMATALPVKFEDTINEALGFIPEREARFVGLESETQKSFTIIDPDIDALKEFIRNEST